MKDINPEELKALLKQIEDYMKEHPVDED